MPPRNRSCLGEPRITYAWVVVALPATAAVAGHVSAAIAPSVAGAAARPAAFWLRQHSVARGADALDLAVAVVSAAPVPAWRTSFPAAAGIFGRGWGLRCWEQRDVRRAEVLSDELPGDDLLGQTIRLCHAVEPLRDSQEGGTAPRHLWQGLRSESPLVGPWRRRAACPGSSRREVADWCGQPENAGSEREQAEDGARVLRSRLPAAVAPECRQDLRCS